MPDPNSLFMKETERPIRLTRQSESPRIAIAAWGKSASHSVTRMYFFGLGSMGKSPTPKYMRGFARLLQAF